MYIAVDANPELKVFKCDKCPKAFTRRIMLKSHQSVHSTQRGFTCQACEKWFPTRSALVRHERTHTGWLFVFHINYEYMYIKIKYLWTFFSILFLPRDVD